MRSAAVIHEWIVERARRIAWERIAKENARRAGVPCMPVATVFSEDMDRARREIEPLLLDRQVRKAMT